MQNVGSLSCSSASFACHAFCNQIQYYTCVIVEFSLCNYVIYHTYMLNARIALVGSASGYHKYTLIYIYCMLEADKQI